SGGILFEVAFKGAGRCAAVADVVADDAQGGDAAEAGGDGDIGRIAIPETETFIREQLPGEEGIGVVFAGRSDIAVAYEIGGGYLITGLELSQQMQEAVDLGIGEGFEAIVVQF